MSGHTPGPWGIGSGYGLYGVEIVGDAGGSRICGIAHVERDVADREGRKIGTEPLERGWANARLIAAAPDLLDFARRVDSRLSALAYVGIELDNDMQCLLAEAREVIAKAQGGAA